MHGPAASARRRLHGGYVALLSTALAAACASKPPPPSFIVITIDTTRADRLGCYGYGRDTSPNIDALAANGVRFDFAIAQSATTPVSCASLLTGRYPYEHGLRTMHGRAHNRLDDDVSTLQERLGKMGYATAGFVSAFPASSHYGLDRGFDLFDESFLNERRPEIGADGTVETAYSQRNASETTLRLLPWLRENAARPFFVWLHYFDPHDVTFVPPAPIQERFLSRDATPGSEEHLRDTYDSEIFFADLHIRAMLDELERLGVRERTVVVVTADHGEGLGDHDWWGHGILYQEQIRVPLVFNGPGVEPGRVIAEPVEHVDLAPTLLEMAGAKPDPNDFDGRSLAAVLRSRRATPRSRVTYSEVHNILAFAPTQEQRLRSEMYSIIRPPLKLIHLARDPARDELYDLVADPRETRNLLAERRSDAEALLADLRSRNAIDGYVPDPTTLTEKEREHLRALGYIR